MNRNLDRCLGGADECGGISHAAAFELGEFDRAALRSGQRGEEDVKIAPRRAVLGLWGEQRLIERIDRLVQRLAPTVPPPEIDQFVLGDGHRPAAHRKARVVRAASQMKGQQRLLDEIFRLVGATAQPPTKIPTQTACKGRQAVPIGDAVSGLGALPERSDARLEVVAAFGSQFVRACAWVTKIFLQTVTVATVPANKRVSQSTTEGAPMHATLPLLIQTHFPPLARRALETLQVNLGYRCNQRCQHCHVGASPDRTEAMDETNVALVLEVLEARNVATLDVTGGAPELHPQFRRLVAEARALGVRVIDRCNLTILSEPGQEDLAEFLAAQQVEITASLPCYLEENVDRQRGGGVFVRSIDGLRRLNALGYGAPGSGLVLNLVYNPQGPSLPPPQAALECDYKRELAARYGVVFNRLYTLTNMPIQRFGSMLVSKGQFAPYMQRLRDSFRPENLEAVMCRTLVSVDWRGNLYDCDFNQMLDLPARPAEVAHRLHLRDLLASGLEGAPIRVADHCYGCTAGQGSSCGGALGAGEAAPSVPLAKAAE